MRLKENEKPEFFKTEVIALYLFLIQTEKFARYGNLLMFKDLNENRVKIYTNGKKNLSISFDIILKEFRELDEEYVSKHRKDIEKKMF